MNLFSLTTIVLMTVILLGGSRDLALAASASLAKAKQEAEAKGYTFLTSHDEILTKAKAEGKLRATTSLSPPTYKAMVSAFKKNTHFLTSRLKRSMARTPLSAFCWS